MSLGDFTLNLIIWLSSIIESKLLELKLFHKKDIYAELSVLIYSIYLG